ncbi:Ig-like domain-containing protein [Paenibacillus sp. p3-SID867]|uniref:Ig-like domain-containing protein n=1 Tax=Paenibacillus sp. p3-SID867 TaxID=2916363 RepID=UPI0021A71D5D|nr:Ig-like domain-containing protein [Paenibacillus sp. p3-SID867]MCT1399286.1 Ig-like domain-containing protein [Paenibacillus sp. p3-SID867]
MSLNRKTTKMFLVVVMMLAMVFPTSVFAASGDVTSIEFDTNESKIYLTVNETSEQLRVLANIEGSSTKKDVTNESTWTSSNTRIVKVDGGLIIPLEKGTARITAKYKGAIKTIDVDVKFAIDEFKLDQPDKVEHKLGTEGLTVKALADGTNDVTTETKWTTSDDSVVKVSKGELTLVGLGSATVTAEYKGLKASFTVKVVAPYQKLAIVPGEDQELLVGDAPVELKVFAKQSETDTGMDVTDKIELKSSNSSVATIEDGKLKPVALGKSTISVSYLGSTAKLDVYVRNPYEALILDQTDFVKNPVLFMNDSITVQAKVRNAASQSIDVPGEWTSSNPLAVSVNGGVITARASGTSTIKVSYLGISKEFSVKVYPTVTKFEAADTEVDVLKGESKSFPKVTGTLLDDEKEDFSSAVNWTSSDEKVVTTEDGKIKAIDAGTATITGKIGSRLVATVPVTVNEKVLVLLPDVEEYQLVMGRSIALPKVDAVFEDGTESDVTSSVEWSLTGSAAVIKDGTIKGLTKGSTTLKGTYLNKEVKIPVVVEQEVVKIVVEPENIDLNIKKSKSIKVTGYYSNGKTISLSSKMNWSSSDTAIVTVSRTSVKAVAEGTATITGSYQGKEAIVKVNVVPKLKKLIASEKKLNLKPGDVKTVTVTAEFDTGAKTNVGDTAVWTTSNSSVAKVTNGRIEAIAKGTARIKGQYNSKTVSITVSVK